MERIVEIITEARGLSREELGKLFNYLNNLLAWWTRIPKHYYYNLKILISLSRENIKYYP